MHGRLRLGLRGVEVTPLGQQQGQVRRRVQVRAQQAAPLVGVDRGPQVFLGLGQVPGPELGGAGVAQDQQGDHVPAGQSETGERARVVGDPAGGGGERDEIAAGAGVPISTRSRTTRRRSARGCGRSSTPAAAAATSSLDLAGRALVDAGCGEGGGELGMAEQHVPRYRGQEHVELRALPRITSARTWTPRSSAASGQRPPRSA